MDGGLPERIVAQGVVVVEILVALGKAEDALIQELFLRVRNEGRVPIVWQDSAEIPDEPETLFELAQEQQTAVAGDVAALEGGSG